MLDLTESREALAQLQRQRKEEQEAAGTAPNPAQRQGPANPLAAASAHDFLPPIYFSGKVVQPGCMAGDRFLATIRAQKRKYQWTDRATLDVVVGSFCGDAWVWWNHTLETEDDQVATRLQGSAPLPAVPPVPPTPPDTTRPILAACSCCATGTRRTDALPAPGYPFR